MQLRPDDAPPCATCRLYSPRDEFISPACYAEALSVYDPVKGREASSPVENRKQFPTCRWHEQRVETWLERNGTRLFLWGLLAAFAAWMICDVAKHCGFPWQACGG